jgi:hypothetical protein
MMQNSTVNWDDETREITVDLNELKVLGMIDYACDFARDETLKWRTWAHYCIVVDILLRPGNEGLLELSEILT